MKSITKLRVDPAMTIYDNIIKYLQKDRCINLNALSYLKYDADVYIYNDDIENGVVIGAQRQNFFFLATCNKGFLDEFWKYLTAGHKMFSGVPKSIADVMLAGREPVWHSPCKVFIHNGTPIFEPSPDFIIERLTLDDAEEVDEYYTYKSDSSINRIRESIGKADSVCIRIDGTLAAWCLVHMEDGSLGPLYTKAEFRGRGLAEAVATRLMRQLADKDMPIYVQIADDNVASLALIKKIDGLEFSHDCVWFGLDKS